MKTKAICSFFVLFAIVAGIGATTPAAFADPHGIETVIESGFGQDCTADGCYTPSTLTVDVGHVITMSNNDAPSIHTFTSGTVDGFQMTPDGTFDSAFLNPGESFDYNADTVGEFPYYCTLHPWMIGTLIVQEAVDEEAMAEAMAAAEAEAQAVADAEAQAVADAEAQAAADAAAEAQAVADAQAEAEVELVVTITDSAMGDGTHVYLEFSEMQVNYEMTATQNGEEIFKEASHAMEMTSDHHIGAVGSDESPIDIEIVSLGIGPEGANQDWTGPVGTVATTQIVPEFGTIAMMILAVAIISIVAVTAKSRVVPRF